MTTYKPKRTTKQGYYVEFNGEFYQSVFPQSQSELSQLHTSIDDAIDYFVNECAIDRNLIVILDYSYRVTK
jgi:hypothetical protein